MNTMIDNTLHELFIASFDYQTDSERWIKRNAVDDIRWYIQTGRASTPWLKALFKANPQKLLAGIARKGSQSTDDNIRTTTSYLKRYCGFEG